MVSVLTDNKYRLLLDSPTYSKYEKELQVEGWPRQLSGILSQNQVKKRAGVWLSGRAIDRVLGFIFNAT